MAAIQVHVETAEDPGFVWLRTSVSLNPERKPGMLIARDDLRNVVLMFLDMAHAANKNGAAAC